MKIIAGEFKGLTLKMPKGIRPTSDKVREALFDILGSWVIGTSVLDLFAGSGALGLEAISRGAKQIAFVDNNPRHIKVIRENFSNLPLKTYLPAGKAGNLPLANFYSLDTFKAIKLFKEQQEKFDLILLDPPYYKELAKKSLMCIGQSDILTRNAIVVAEHYKKDKLEDSAQLNLFKIKNYGDTILSFYTLNRQRSALSGSGQGKA